MHKSSKLLVLCVTVFLLVSATQVECRRTYTSRSSSSGRGNRGKNQPSGGLFSSWFGGSKTSGSSSSSGSVSKPVPSTAQKNWNTATSGVSAQSKSNWANPYYKSTGGSAVPSAPRDPNYGWKSSVGGSSKPGSAPYPSSNIGSQGYPVQSGVQHSSYGGFKPVPNTGSTGFQTSQSNVGGFKPVSSVPSSHSTSFGGYHPSPNTQFQPSSVHTNPSSFGGYHPSPSATNTGYKPSNTYQPSQPSYGAQPSHSVPHQPSYSAPSYHPSASHPHSAPSYHPSASHPHSAYPQQPGGHYSAPSYSGYPVQNTFGSAAPTYQGNKLFSGSSGHYGYPGSGSWGIDSYGAKKSSSGTGKLLTGLAVGAAGGYLTSSLVNRISNPWKYSGYGYGSGFGYGGSSLGYGSPTVISTRDESAFERGYERGFRNRQDEDAKQAPAAAPAPQPEDPASKFIQCVLFDPQTQQTLINPNCSCTVTTSLDERTGQPLSVHHCTTLNGLVMQPVPLFPNQGGVNSPSSTGVNGGINTPGAVPSYGAAYQGDTQYGAGPYMPFPQEAKSDAIIKSEGSTMTAVVEPTEKKTEGSTTEAKAMDGTTETKAVEGTTEAKAVEGTTGSVIKPEVVAFQNVTNVESDSAGGNKTESVSAAQTDKKPAAGGQQDNHKGTAEFYGQLQKIVNMGNFVDGG